MQSGTIPVTGNGLGVDRHLGSKVLGNTVENEAGDPEVVPHLDTLAGTDLEFPLGRHDLSVCARDVNAGVEAGLVVGLNNVTLDDLAGSNTAVVRALRSRETTSGPAVRALVVAKQGVLLLETEPRLPLGVEVHDLLAFMSEVELVGRTIGIPALREDKDVGRAAERVREDRDGSQVNIGVVAGSLAGR